MGKRLSIMLLALAITLSLCSCNYQKKTTETKTTIYAVWLNYNELSMMNEADKSELAFRKKAEDIVRNCADNGINRIFVQVRPFSDSFYKSEIFPSTVYLSGRQGEYVGYDVLSIMCEIQNSTI